MVDQGKAWLGRACIFALGGLISGCASEPNALLLDQICDPDLSDDGGFIPSPPPGGGFSDPILCQTSGDAQQTTGMTPDAVAYHLGPSTGALHLHLSAFETIREPTWSLEILARSTRPEGSELFRTLTWSTCAACPPDPTDATGLLTEDYSWVRAVDNESGMSDPFASLPNDALVTLRGADIDILDVRAPR